MGFGVVVVVVCHYVAHQSMHKSLDLRETQDLFGFIALRPLGSRRCTYVRSLIIVVNYIKINKRD